MANVSQLQPAAITQVQSNSSEPGEKDADFLALRMLNKRARPRLSPEPLDLTPIPGKARLFAVANSKGWFAAITRDAGGPYALILSPLAELRSAFESASADDDQPFKPQRRVTLSGAVPQILTFASNDSRILLGSLDGSIAVYASHQLFSTGEGPIQPLHAFTSSSTVLLSIEPNPGDMPELVAILRDCSSSPGSLAVELLDVQKLISSGGWMAGRSPSTTPTSISWSPKGKQLALGLQSGDIITFSPTATATPKSSIPHPPSANSMSVLSVHWLSSSSFYAIYAPPGQLVPDVEQAHFHVWLDAKNNSAQDIKFRSPYLPYPGLRPPGEFLVCLRGWDPSKVLLIVGDSTSSDIGVIGSVADGSSESWHNLSLEETSTPSLPLDKDQNDTVMIGMDVDLTSDASYRHSTASGEAIDLPAHPIMYVYASDGTVLGWHVLNVAGTPYPGMVTVSDMSISEPSLPSAPSSMVRELSSDMQTTPMVSPTVSAPAVASTFPPAPSVFGQTSAFGAQPSAFGQTQTSVFGQTSAFGQTKFGQSAFAQSPFSQQSTSAFGKPTSFAEPAGTSPFGSTTTASPFGQPPKSAFGSTAPSSGFAAFSSTGPATFGQPTFGFGGLSQAAPTMPQPPASAPEESMTADDTPSLGAFGLGAAASEDADSRPSIFGKPSVPISSGPQSTDGSIIKPGTGFAAFAGLDRNSPFAKPSVFTSTAQPSVFGTTAFQLKPESTPTTSTFGAPSAFGQSAFGQSSFGQIRAGDSTFGKPSFGIAPAAAPARSTTPSTTTGFSAFASNTTNASGMAAAKTGPSAKPIWATSDTPKPAEGTSTTAATSVFGKSLEPSAQKVPSVTPSKPAEIPTPLNNLSTSPSPFTSSPPFSTASAFAPREPIVKDDDSRSPSPAPVQQKDTTPSVFTSSAPGPATGAFSNLKTTPSAFVKPASGFFGEPPIDSPFFKQPQSKPVSAFALVATPTTPTSTPPKASTAAPAFGTSSMPSGAFKSAFPPATAPPVQSVFAPSTGGFAAFSGGSGGGFSGLAAGGGKSFSDLLRSGGNEPKKEPAAEPSVSVSQPPVSTTPVSTPTKELVKPSSTPPPTAKPEKVEEGPVEAKPSAEPVEPKEKAKATGPLAVHESLESISSSSSSFVKVSAEEEGEIVEEGAAGEGEGELRDDAESFLSDVPSESEEEDDEEDEDEDEEEEEEGEEEEDSEQLSDMPEEEEEPTEDQVKKEPEPTEVPLPATSGSTRSPSTTPKGEHPKIMVSTVPSAPPPPSPSPSVSVPRVSPDFSTTTPPGSPTKDAAPTPGQAPPLKPSPPPSTPFGLAPRTNNRPIRSSPLANTPLVIEGEAEKSPSAAVPVFTPPPASIFTPPVSVFVPPAASAFTTSAASVFTPPPASVFSPPTSAVTPSPPPFTAQPAVPKVPFGQWAPPATVAPTEGAVASSSRPKTPPTLSLFPSVGDKPVTTGFAPSFGAASPWGTSSASKPADTTPHVMKTPPPMFFGGQGQPSLFGSKAPSVTPPSTSPGSFGMPSSLATPSSLPLPLPATPAVPPVPAPAPTPSPSPEQGMQAECVLLLHTLGRELENLKQLAAAASARAVELKKTSGVTHQKADLADPRKWVFGDIKEYGRILEEVQADVKELKLQRASLPKALQELDSNMLKAGTRKEEIIRFDRARTDTEFAKMLKVRTLSPEYAETQSQLRKDIRAIKDRVQKLEDHLQASKKRINELKTGKPSLRPPSLDTLNRTFRNVDIAISQQKQEISKLRHRLAKTETLEGGGARDALAVSSSRRPLNVTQDVAFTTAAALNAERSAQRLKKALLASRTQPLLNTMAVAASPPPTSFQTPQKTTVDKPEVKLEAKTPEALFTVPTTSLMSFPSSLPTWAPSPPSDFGSPTYDISPSRNRGSSKHHQKPITIKKTASPSGPSQPSQFEWKPVEPVKPVSSLPFAILPTGSK